MLFGAHWWYDCQLGWVFWTRWWQTGVHGLVAAVHYGGLWPGAILLGWALWTQFRSTAPTDPPSAPPARWDPTPPPPALPAVHTAHSHRPAPAASPSQIPEPRLPAAPTPRDRPEEPASRAARSRSASPDGWEAQGWPALFQPPSGTSYDRHEVGKGTADATTSVTSTALAPIRPMNLRPRAHASSPSHSPVQHPYAHPELD